MPATDLERTVAALVTVVILGGTAVVATRVADGDHGPRVVTCAAPPTRSAVAPRTGLVRAAAAVRRSVVALTAASNTGEILGSGIVIRSDGTILTNNHLVADVAVNGGVIDVALLNGQTAQAVVVGRDPEDDIAVIRTTDLDDVPVAQLGSSRALRIGDRVLAVGNALGQPDSVSAGIVSGLARETCVKTSQAPAAADQLFGSQPSLPRKTEFDNLIQTDAHINPGNSGGALVDMTGRVVGVTTLALTVGGSEGSVGIGFAVPIEVAYRDATRLLESAVS